MISVYTADQLKRFAPFSYLNHSLILSLNVKIHIRFTVFLQISLCFFICQELCCMKDLCISFTSSCFLFPVRGGNNKFQEWGFTNLGRVIFAWGEGEGQYPITCHELLITKFLMYVPFSS